jgi:hypothetical protein
LTPAAGASLGYMIGALLALGVNLLMFFADADRLELSRGAGGPSKGDVKSVRRKDREQKKRIVKED